MSPSKTKTKACPAGAHLINWIREYTDSAFSDDDDGDDDVGPWDPSDTGFISLRKKKKR